MIRIYMQYHIINRIRMLYDCAYGCPQSSYFLIFLVITPLILLNSCVTNNNKEEEYEWINTPTLRFVTEDFRYSQDRYSPGDSISIGFASYMYYKNVGFNNNLVLLTTTSCDTEQVDITSHYIDYFLVPEYICGGVRIYCDETTTVIPNNGMIEVLLESETIKATYYWDNMNTLILGDSAIIKRE